MSGNDGYTKVLLHLDGANGSTTISDTNQGGSAHTWTAHTGTIATAQSKFGGASWDATAGGWTDTPDSADFALGSGDWTIDCWFYRSGGDGTIREMAGKCDASVSRSTLAFALALNGSNVVTGALAVGTTQIDIAGTTAITTTGWHHVALVRTGNTLKLFVDGVQEGGDVGVTGTINNSANKLAVGRLGEYPGTVWNGYVDEFRISIGIARWTSNFTPPSAAYSIDPLVAAVGSFALDGRAATFQIQELSAYGSYALSGQAAAITWGTIGTFGSLTLSAQPLAFSTQFVDEFGNFSLSHQPAAFTSTLVTADGLFSGTGIAATIQGFLLASFGSFVLSGVDVLEPILGTEAGQFTLIGQDAFLGQEFGGGGGTITGGTFSRGRWRALQKEIAAERERQARIRRRERERRRAVARRAAAAAKAARDASRAKEDAVRAELARHRAIADAVDAIAGARSIAAAADGSAQLVGAAQVARQLAAVRDEDEALTLLLAA